MQRAIQIVAAVQVAILRADVSVDLPLSLQLTQVPLVYLEETESLLELRGSHLQEATHFFIVLQTVLQVRLVSADEIAVRGELRVTRV